MELLGTIGDAHVRDHRAVLLRETSHVENGDALPSRWAAMPSSAPIVTTPVPPIPVTRTPYGSVVEASAGSGSREKSAASAFFGLRKDPPSTVTKLGQNPLTQE